MPENEKWVKIYTSTQRHQVDLLEGLLQHYGIAVVIINKQDSPYGLFGEIELYVQQQQALEALSIINLNEAYE